MRIEKRGQIPWAIFSTLLLASGAFGYYVYDKHAVGGPSGSSAVGLTFGIISAAFMAFVGALSLRRRVRSLRLGSARMWLRGHLWLGLLSLPFAWFHAGFHHGGTLTAVMMYLFYFVIISGIVGLGLQQFLPTTIKQTVPNETLWSQIERTIASLKTERALLATSGSDPAQLAQIDLQCRRLRRQQSLQRWLSGWLLVHVPLSMVLLLLTAIHIIMALRLSF